MQFRILLNQNFETLELKQKNQNFDTPNFENKNYGTLPY